MSLPGDDFINVVEHEKIEQLRNDLRISKVDDTLFTDRQLEKFLIVNTFSNFPCFYHLARNIDVENAETQILNHLRWKRKWDVDNILDWEVPLVLSQYVPGGFSGWTKDQHAVWVDIPGKLDIKGLCLSAKKSDIMKFKIYQVEKLISEIHEKKAKDEIILISDMSEFTLKMLFSPGMEILLKVLVMLEDNYPETLHKCYVINAPKIFPIIYEVVKPFITNRTKSKLNILSSDWKEKLIDLIGPDALPKYWGGNLMDNDGDVYCRSKICMGGSIPTSFYLKDQMSFDTSSFTKVNICRSQVLEVTKKVTVPHSILTWNFQTEKNDIRYGLFYRPDEEHSSKDTNKEISLISFMRVNSHLVPEDGVYDCKLPGYYTIRFDNSYSWLTSKSLYYSIQIKEPQLQDFISNEKYNGVRDNYDILQCSNNEDQKSFKMKSICIY